MVVIKVGGNELDQEGFMPGLAQAVAALHSRQACIVVHGGGRLINELLERLAIAPSFHEGQRVTDRPTLEVVEMVLSGRVNKSLVQTLAQAGLEGLGVSGVDLGLLQVEPWAAELGYVGRITHVRRELFQEWASRGFTPVVSPISSGPGGRYNVNADHAAGAIAAAVAARRLVFLTNVPGVQIDGRTVAQLTTEEVNQHIASGRINGGMIPKVAAAQAALEQGVAQVLIANLAGLGSLSGTHLVPAGTEAKTWRN